MSRKLIRKEPCPLCRAEGHDKEGNNLVIYTDGSYCFARHGPVGKAEVEWVESTEASSIQYVGWRGITKETMKAYGCMTNVGPTGVPISVMFPYGPHAYKERKIDVKGFRFSGTADDIPLFGMDKFSAGSAQAITITEGELDALSAYQMLGSKYPVVSVRGAQAARGNCERARDYLNSFSRIYLCFDNDGPGRNAAADVAKLFDINKIYFVELTKFKDANEYLERGEVQEFTRIWWNSKPYMPKGVVADYGSIESILRSEGNQSIATYPFPTLQAMSYGIRLGEINLFTAQEKVGKTEIMRAIEYHLLKTTDDNIGIIHLEEEEKRSVLGLVGYELGVPAHLPDSGLSVEDQLAAYKRLTKKDGRVHYYAHFGSTDPNAILDVIRYLVGVCHCKYIFLDHITMLVTGFEDDDERKKLDYLSTRLAMMVRELDFCLFLVSHVNDDGKTRGSRNIAKTADLLVHLDRDTTAEDPESRNTTHLTVRGNRYGSSTGPAGKLVFNPKTFQVTEKEPEVAGDFNPNF